MVKTIFIASLLRIVLVTAIICIVIVANTQNAIICGHGICDDSNLMPQLGKGSFTFLDRK